MYKVSNHSFTHFILSGAYEQASVFVVYLGETHYLTEHISKSAHNVLSGTRIVLLLAHQPSLSVLPSALLDSAPGASNHAACMPHSLHKVPADPALVSSYAVLCSLSFDQQHIVQVLWIRHMCGEQAAICTVQAWW